MTHFQRSIIGSILIQTCLISAFVGDVVLAGESQQQTSELTAKRVSFLYDVDLEMLYLGDAQRISSPNAFHKKFDFVEMTNQHQNNASTLGLRKSRLGFEWSLPRGMGLEMALRPEALNADSNQPLREVDTRSGRVIEEMPSIHLLDEYRFVYKRPTVGAHVGVETSIFENFNMISDTLEFGLRVRGPEKAFGAGLEVHNFDGIPGLQKGQSIGVRLNILSGSDERHVLRNHDADGIGESPAKRDPYWGGAVNIQSILEGETKISFGVAAVESRKEGVKLKRDWLHLGLRRMTSTSFLPKILLGMEARQLKQSSKLEGTQISDELLTSIGITSDLRFTSEDSLLVGFWFGTGDLHPKGIQSYSKDSKSIQANLGWKWLSADHLELVSMISREWRKDGHEDGGSVGGFRREGKNESVQSRVAIQFRYHLGDQIL